MHAHIAEGRRIFDTVVGSQAYGTSRPESDEDTVAVCIPTEEYFFSSKSFEQVNYSVTDRVIYCVRKAIRLMADNNPNMLDLLFTPERCVKLKTKYWEMIESNSSKFISKKCKFTFSGYAIAQLERIRTHRGFLLNPPKGAPSRIAFGLPEQSVFPASQIDAIVLFADDFFPSDKKQYITEELKAIQSDMILPLLRENVIEEYRPIAMEFFRLGVKSQMDAIKAIGNQFIKDAYKDAASKIRHVIWMYREVVFAVNIHSNRPHCIILIATIVWIIELYFVQFLCSQFLRFKKCIHINLNILRRFHLVLIGCPQCWQEQMLMLCGQQFPHQKIVTV